MSEESKQESVGLSAKLVRNTLYNILGRFCGIISTLILTPYIIQHIGMERFGIWAIIGVITGYFGLLDFGVGASFVKYTAEFYAKRDYQKINRLVNLGVVFYLLLGALVFSLAIFFIHPLLNLFKVPAGLYGEAKFVFLTGIFIFLASNAASPFNAVITGLQRMDLANKLAILVLIPNILGVVFFLRNGYGLSGLIINNLIIFIISALLSIIACFKVLPELKLNLFKLDKEMFARLFSFGFKMQIVKISYVVSNQTDKIILANFLSLSLVAFYQIGSYIINYVIIISSLLVSALMPAFSEIEAKGDRNLLIKAYLKSTQYLSIIVLPLFIFLIVASPRIIFIWMGLGYEKAGLIIQILAIAWMFHTIAQSAGSVSVAIGKPQLLAAASMIITISNIALSLILIKKFGFYGAAWGTVIAVNSGVIYFIFKLHRSLKIPLSKIGAIIIPYFLAAILPAVVISGLDRVPALFSWHLSRLAALTFLSVQILIFIAIYLAVIYLSRLYDTYDIEFLEQKTPGLAKVIKIFFPGIRRIKV